MYRFATKLAPGFAEANYRLGRAYERQRNWKKAASAYRRAVDLKPQSAQWWGCLGRVSGKQGNWKLAVKSYKQAAKLKPTKATWHVKLAEAQEHCESWSEAEKTYSLALKLRPRQPLVYIRAATLAEKLGKWKAAARAYKRAIKYKDNLPQDRFIGRLKDIPDAGHLFFLLGNACDRSRQLDAAAEAFRFSAAANPENAEPLIRLGNIAVKKKEWVAADEAYSAALRLKPSDISLHYQLALVRQESAGDKAALEILERALELVTDHDWKFRLAQAIERCGEVERACAIYLDLLSPDRGEADTKYRTSEAISRHVAKRRRVTLGNGENIFICSNFEAFDLENSVSLARALNVSLRPISAEDALQLSNLEKGEWEKCFQQSLKLRFSRCKDWLHRNGYFSESSDRSRVNYDTSVIKTVGSWSIVNGRWPVAPVGQLLFHGTINSSAKTVFIFINDIVVKAINVRERGEANKSLPRQFSFTIKENVVSALPKVCRVSIGCSDGILLSPMGELEVLLIREQGQGTLLKKLENPNYHINKKGRLDKKINSAAEWREAALTAYTKFSTYLNQRLGRQIFIFHGTLLGAIREGDFIPNDDDFDIAYFSESTTAAAVKKELKSLIKVLAKDGWPVKTNKHRRMFKVQINGLWIDCFAVWAQDGKIWSHSTVCYPGTPSEFLPLRQINFKGVEVNIPNKPEICLQGIYGEGWRVPDPGYQSPRPSKEVKKNLARALLTSQEVIALQRQGILK